ncbi:hypothetical protein [Propioniciclava tarda]|uniref:Uncharacterized protein n=1 Tax=Propioniciclava tarda TaxID=433330 RepID=A0A4Q9KLE0_PROTD|nr:hypothetical protein [Propioniciclava tarda]TBT95035.1 hypothetical protein ET996_07110 [Propioniciclava tarda]SMO54241.1 hypothetical protein SAMN06266982_10628 [Propioniciclava tarda]
MSDNEFQADEFQTPDAPADVTAEEIVDKADDKLTIDKIDKVTPNQLGDLAMKFASETAYAAAGFANLVADKAREFADKQREFADKQRATLAEAGEGDPGKAILEQFTAQVNKFVEELGHTYKDLADRGRDALAKAQAQAKSVAKDDAPGMFDLVDGAETAEPASTVAEDAIDEAEILDHEPLHVETTEVDERQES